MSRMTFPGSDDTGVRKDSWRNSHSIWGAVAIWLVSVIAAMSYLAKFSTTPGSSSPTPSVWPSDSQIPFSRKKPMLILFAHPHCSCTRASLDEFELLVARCEGQFSAHVVFVRCAGMSKEWTKTELWRHALTIPGVKIHVDEGGVEARRFGSLTSGQTVLYNQKRQLIFNGGITPSRGHSGDNPGFTAIIDSLRHSTPARNNTAVFGCPLFDSEGSTQSGATACKLK
ncbi:MAG: hypothetical protein JWM99_972 [Verrucomicrobiales bacterium]|nr:hypothetical protein [Verrucomicrobiales bacterium]